MNSVQSALWWLSHKVCWAGSVQGYMSERPSAFFGEKTTQAVIAYQNRLGISEPQRGIVGKATRRVFAKKNNLPTPEEIESENKELRGSVRNINLVEPLGGLY